MADMIAALLVFTAVASADVCWARYVGAVGARSRWVASSWAAALYVLGSFSVVEYTANHWLLIPAVLGSFAGTAVGVRL